MKQTTEIFHTLHQQGIQSYLDNGWLVVAMVDLGYGSILVVFQTSIE
jgi:hypothetical protein